MPAEPEPAPRRRSPASGGCGHDPRAYAATVRVARSLAVGVGAAVAAFVLAALVLTVVGLYQSGHGHRAWTDTDLIAARGVALSVADTICVAAAACAALTCFAVSQRAQSSVSPSSGTTTPSSSR